MSATNVLTKAYVIERIEARKGKIDLLIAEAKKGIESRRVALVPQVDRFVKDWSKWWTDAAEDATKLVSKYEAEEDLQKKFDFAQKLSNLRTGRSVPDSYVPQNRGIYPRTDPDADARALIAQLVDEKTALDHALIYLRDLPITDMSITSLRQLGLLDVIKFSIPKTGAGK